jgi:dihydrofolate reductase
MTSARTATGGTGPAAGDGRPLVGLIWAQARGGVIGAGGTMPWHLPEDLAHFKRTTAGAPVVMGRRTWLSFPPPYRPLPGRTNIVITRDDGFADDGAVRAGDLPEALRLAREALTSHGPSSSPTLWVIGGGAVYREAIDRADLLVVTEIDLEVEGDTTAPAIPSAFSLAAADPDPGWHEAANGLRYRILTYTR